MHEYTAKDGVQILHSKHFKENKIIHPKFKNRCGMIKVYSPRCVHCQNMMPMIRLMGKELSKHKFYTGVLNGANPDNIPIMKSLDVKFFPSLYFVTPTGKLVTYEKDHKFETILSTVCAFTRQHLSVPKTTRASVKVNNQKKRKAKAKAKSKQKQKATSRTKTKTKTKSKAKQKKY